MDYGEWFKRKGRAAVSEDGDVKKFRQFGRIVWKASLEYDNAWATWRNEAKRALKTLAVVRIIEQVTREERDRLRREVRELKEKLQEGAKAGS